MKLLCWNVRDTNANTELLAQCLSAHTPDVALLQEVNEPQLAALRARFTHVATARDSVSKGAASHLVIAANRAFQDIRVAPQPAIPRPSPLARFQRLDQFLDTLCVLVEDDTGQPVHLINLHTTSFAPPSLRAREVEAAIAQAPSDGACVIAGDFNSIAHPMNTWALALPLAIPPREWPLRERVALENRMAAAGFAPSVDQITFPRLRMRLDQVFRRNVGLQRASVDKRLWGSDHRPLVVELGPAN